MALIFLSWAPIFPQAARFGPAAWEARTHYFSQLESLSISPNHISRMCSADSPLTLRKATSGGPGSLFCGASNDALVIERFGACDSNALLVAQWMRRAKSLQTSGQKSET